MGIRGQLALLVPGLVALGFALTATVAIRQEWRSELEDFRVQQEHVLTTVGVTAAVQVAQNDVGGLDTLVAHLTEVNRDGDLRELVVLDDQGRVLAHSEPQRFNEVLTDDLTREALAADRPVWHRTEKGLRIAVPAVSGIRWATVEATYSLDRIEASLDRMRLRWVVGSLCLIVFVAGLIYFALDRMVVRPVRSLQQAVRRMGEGHLTTRVPALTGHELKELSANVNRMAAALQSERENLEKAVADRTRELQEANVRLERLAVTDGLTGLFNHRRFYEALNAELLRCERHKHALSVLMFDVDHFKRVNDSLGHPVGDELLRRLAEVLSDELRQTDLIARYGGEEFAVILPETNRTEALAVGERMRGAVEKRMNEGQTWKVQVTVSVGAACFPDDGKTAEQVLAAADQALYVAKRQGRNKVIGARGPV